MAIKLICLLLAILFIVENSNGQKALADNAPCSTGCNWEDPTIWADGIVPIYSDTVDFQLKKDYKVIVNTQVIVKDFEIGTGDRSDGSHNLEIASGASFTSDQVTAFLTATITVNQNASITAHDGTINGKMIVYGTTTFTLTSLSISTTSNQISTKGFIYATLELNNGTVSAATQVYVSTTANIYGNGNINTPQVKLDGTIKPGFDGKIGFININGSLHCDGQTEIHMDIGAQNSYDHIGISGTLNADGNLYANRINSYDPLAHSLFYVMNHTELVGGFDTVRTAGWKGIFSKSWQVKPAQEYTALLYDDASSVLISFSMILVCLFFTLF